jgi:ketol-acid reductoisomerase
MKKLAIIGFGNQAKAWALNLRDSGWEISIGLRPGSASVELASKLNFSTFNYLEANQHLLFAILTPDESHHEIVNSIYKSKSGQEGELSFIYAHGFSLQYTDLRLLDCNHILLAPKAIASELRYEYETKGKNGAVYSFEYLKDKSLKENLLSLGKDLGLTSLHEASIKDETIADLFSEQTLLCSTLPYAAVHSFNKLRQKGISQEVAFFECWHEVKLIASTMVKLGPEKFFNLISPNALVGSEIGKSTLFNDEYNKKLDDILEHITSGNFKEDIDNTDFQTIKSDVLTFWKNQELTHVHQRMEQDLY